MPSASQPTDRLKMLFRRRTCWMLAELALALDYARITVRRLLNQVGYFRSYTHNGKWYTLPDSPNFNPEGIWHHRGIGFSKQGTLTATITHLVGRSPAGLSAGELAQKLRHPCHAVLTNLHKQGALDRIKVHGQFRYLSTEQPVNRRQRERSAPELSPEPSQALTTQAAVYVLIEHIKNSGLSFEQIAVNVQRQWKISVAAENIARFFADHGLKKTRETPTAKP